MNKTAHPFFRWPGSLLWLLPLVGSLLLFWCFGGEGSVWWYIVVPALTSLVFLDLVTSVWFGIATLVLLFIYCSIGSSGAPVSFAIWEPTAWVNLREMRGLEMTEFEWFHWWPFKWLVAILCLNMSIVTIRKIPFNTLSVGVWAIHGGVIVMVLGCVIYFSQKIEGDVLVSRRVVVVEDSGGVKSTMVVTPANSITVNDTTFTITDINPSWSLMSGEDAGKEVYTVSVLVQGPEDVFTRQLIAGYPEYTEDIVQSEDPSQPMARAKNILGRALVDENLKMSLDYDSKDEFYVTQSGAIYLREISEDGTPQTNWFERPIDNLPRFNDYLSVYDEVWPTDGTLQKLKPLEIDVVQTEGDPIDGRLIVNGYLRYAYINSQITGGGNDLFPVIWVTLRKGDEAVQTVQLYAFDQNLNTADASLMAFKWISDEDELSVLESSLSPSFNAVINGEQYSLNTATVGDFKQIGDTEYSFKINSVQNNLNISGTVVSLVIVEINKGDKTWQRWVFNNPSMNRDVAEGENHEGAPKFVDDNIKMTYSAGGAPITIVGGLKDKPYVMLTSIAGDTPVVKQLEVGEPADLTDEVTITIDRAEPFTYSDTRPMIVPPIQRDPSASNMYSMVKIVVPLEGGSVTSWLPYHHYPFESQKEVVRRFQYKPTVLRLPNGKLVEFMFSRKRAPLPTPVALDTFEIDSHLGGFTGNTSSILNWRSVVKFLDGTDNKLAVSVNDPKPYGELWFFQSQWDPPDSMSKGLNYTVLGIGNRHGVFTMLLGCCLTVAGMVWAFYVKPVIKRNRQKSVYAEMAK
ncbi:MAG: hypothetical protein QF718_07625 [Phycisphaerales bacterium]|jgi:hypothetical protein|nr:hypothetical protein [Phycisphaerales bacterium]